jgi:CRISPR system Cascade subunit CasE
MPDERKKLNMICIEVDQRKLFEFAKRRRIPLYTSDFGYTLHCFFTELFGPNFSPKPFSAQEANGVMLPILAYTCFTKDELEQQAQKFSTQELLQMVDWNNFSVKAMPNKWVTGHTLAFEVRVCPVERKSNTDQNVRQKGAEIDVYLGHVWKHGKDIDRGTIYEKWTKDIMEKAQPDKKSAMKIHEIKTKGFRRVKFIRRDRNRRANIKERPEAFIGGVLEIIDSDAFTELLTKGIGRHRAFGFGMLLLKPLS